MQEYNYSIINEETLETTNNRLYVSDEFYTMMVELSNKREFKRFWDLYSQTIGNNSHYLAAALPKFKTGLSKFNYIDILPKDNGLISFMPGDKKQEQDQSGKWLPNGRQAIKPGRFINQFFHPALIKRYEINDKSLEALTSLIKGRMSTDDWELKIIDGEEIRAAYYQINYLDENAEIRGGKASSYLHGSCMRYEKCQPWFDLYVEEEKIKMVVMIHKPTGKIAGRALLWEDVEFHEGMRLTDKPEIFKFMDRVYAYREWQIEFMFDWAKENGYIKKHRQTADDKVNFEMLDGTIRKGLMIANITKQDCFYPYLDTFTFLMSDKLRLVNNNDYISAPHQLTSYEDGNRAVNNMKKPGHIECYHCENSFRESDTTLIDDEHVCGNCRDDNYRYVESREEYIHNDHCSYDDISDEWIHDDDAIAALDDNGDYVTTNINNTVSVSGTIYTQDNSNIATLHNGEYCHIDNCTQCAHDGNWYHVDETTFVECGLDVDVANDNLEAYMAANNLEYDDDEEIIGIPGTENAPYIDPPIAPEVVETAPVEVVLSELDVVFPPDPPITRFNTGDHIVLLEGDFSSSYRQNFVYKQRISAPYLRSEMDSVGSAENGWTAHMFNKSARVSNDWRYATPEEIRVYNEIGRPYDINEPRNETSIAITEIGVEDADDDDFDSWDDDDDVF